MMREGIKIAIAIALLSIAAADLGTRAAEHFDRLNSPSPGGGDAQGQSEANPGHWYAKPDWWIAGGTVGLFIATSGLWVVTALLWRTTRRAVIDGEAAIAEAAKAAEAATRQAETTDRTAERQLRAYVFIENAWLKQTTGHSAWEIRYKVKNFGQTPASNVVVIDTGKAIDPAADASLPIPQDITEYGALAPSGDFIDCWTDKIEFVTRTDLREQRKTIYLAGKVDYVDAFGTNRWTTFCYSITGEIPDDGEMDVNETGNEYY